MKRILNMKSKNIMYALRKNLKVMLLGGALAAMSLISAQETSDVDSVRYISGIVRDAKTKAPITAAQIQALNESASATTDINGAFKIQVVSKGEMLLVKAYDYNTIEYPVRGKSEVIIELYPESFSSLYNEVNGINGEVRSSYSTGALNGTSEIGKPTYVSVDDVIQSRVGGDVRSVTRSGLAGIGSSLFIRGFNSLNLNAQPLFVVDGIIWNNFFDMQTVHDGFFANSLADIDLNDIESVTVIKDGTSIYGSKGSNGVIVVKTKRGAGMATKIEVNAVGGVTQAPTSLPTMNGDQFRLYWTELAGGYDLSETYYEELAFLNDDPSGTEYNRYHNKTDWDNEVYQQGRYQSYNINVNGGDERALYAFSLGYTGNTGVVNSTDMQRINTRFNADINLTKNAYLGVNIAFTNLDRNMVDDGVNFYTSPTYLAQIKTELVHPNTYTTNGDLTTDYEDSDVFGVGNPTAVIENSMNTNRHYRLNIALKPEFKLSKTWTFSNQFNYSLNKFRESYYSPIVGVALRPVEGYGYSENMARGQVMRSNDIFNEARFNYKNKFGSHRINADAGLRYISNFFESYYAEGHNSGTDQNRELLSDLDFRSATGHYDKIKSLAYYANADYSFDNRFFVTGTMSLDASSRFGRETQGGLNIAGRSWAIFPSVNGAWLMSSENFMENVNFINHLKLRAGAGLSGNDDIDPYAWTPYFGATNYMNVATGLVISNIGNEEIQWETSRKLNGGLDLIMLNNRVSLSADVYSNYTTDLLYLKELPEVFGTGSYWANGGELSNIGYEVSANLKMLNLQNFQWEVGASVGHYTNTIEALPDGAYTTSIYGAEILTSVGNAAGVFYGYKTNGIYTTAEAAENDGLKIVDGYGTETYFAAGDVRFEDAYADGIIDEKDKQIIGDPNPDFYGSFNSRFNIRNFTVDALFTFSYGNDVYNYLRASLESGSDTYNQSTAVLNRWKYEGQVTTQPKAVYGDPMGNARFSDRWIEDGSYLRFKTLSINYKVPLSGSKTIKGLNIWASANNLFTFTNYLGRDPEVSMNSSVLYQGIDAGLLPLTTSYYVGIKLNL